MVKTWKDQKVQLKQSAVVRKMEVTSTDQVETGTRGTVKFNGKTKVVKYVGYQWNEQ